MGTYSTEMAALINYYPLSGILVQSISLQTIYIKNDVYTVSCIMV